MKKIVVAIDGPAGAGKSTIAKLAAEKLGYAYIDTGAMYRSVAWKFLQTGREFDEAFISELANTMIIEFKPEAKINRVFVDGTEVTEAIRTPEVTAIVSRVAATTACSFLNRSSEENFQLCMREHHRTDIAAIHPSVSSKSRLLLTVPQMGHFTSFAFKTTHLPSNQDYCLE